MVYTNSDMKLLDLCCGKGGWSKGFEGIADTIEGIDVVDVGYPYKLRLADIRTVSGFDYKGYDVIVASPPCRDFSQITTVEKARLWKVPVDPQRGVELVTACLRIIAEAEPKLWLLENVPGLLKYITIKPVMIVRIAPTMRRVFFGNFPLFPIIQDTFRPNTEDFKGKLRSWDRAEIPLCVSRAAAQTFASFTAH